MKFAAGFSWMNLIPGLWDGGLLAPLGEDAAHIAVPFAHAVLASAVVLLFALGARIGLERAKSRQGLERYFADSNLSLRNLAEMFVGAWQGMMSDLLSKEDIKTFMPFIGSLFVYIFTCNILGIFPGFLPPTDNINTSVGMAAIVFLVFNYVGFRRDFVGYLKHIAGPVWWLIPLMGIVETVSLVVRPVALTIRLTGNMFGDHMVFSIFSGMVPVFVPVPFLLLAILVSTIQAFVFSLLAVIYISLSVPHHEHDEAHH